MNSKTPSLATLFAAGAFVAASAAPTVAATPVSTHAGSSLAEAGCGAKDAKDAKCGKGAKPKKEAKDTKDAKKKGEKDASCGKGSCGSQKKG